MRRLLVACILLGLLVSGCNSTSDARTPKESQGDAGLTGKPTVTQNGSGERAEPQRAAPTHVSRSSQPQSEPAGFPPGISMHSTGVKKIGGRYRYFFYAYNNTNVTFMGRITIRYDTDLIQGMIFESDTFTIYANRGGSFYCDRRTAPCYTGEHGEAGVKRFYYELTDEQGKQVAAAPMELSTRYSIYP